MMSIEKTDCPLLQKGVKRTRKTVTLENKMFVTRKMEAGKKSVCSSLSMALATVSTIMGNAEKIKQLAQKTTKLHASHVSYSRNFNIERIGQSLTSWIDDLNKKRIPLTQHAIAAKARSLFDEIQQTKRR